MGTFKKYRLKGSRAGQNMIEYILVFAGVVAVLVIAAGPGGILTRKIDESVNEAVRGIGCAAYDTCYDPAGCPAVCGNDCCETARGETPANCSDDCSCSGDADCDDGSFCNGAETCVNMRCREGTPPEVDDGVACTVDACVEGAGITHTPDHSVCDDGIACNGIEVCDAVAGCQPGGGDVCADCIGPDGAVIAHGASRTYYAAETVPPGDLCVSQARTCNDGVLSGSYTYPDCSVSGGSDCTGPDGTVIPDGGRKRYYQSDIVPGGSRCDGERRECRNGILSGSYTYPDCCEQRMCGPRRCGGTFRDGCGGTISCGPCDAVLTWHLRGTVNCDYCAGDAACEDACLNDIRRDYTNRCGSRSPEGSSCRREGKTCRVRDRNAPNIVFTIYECRE